MSRFLVAIAAALCAAAQPPGPPPPGGGGGGGAPAGASTSGEASSTVCGNNANTCTTGGADNYVTSSLTLSGGVFSGWITYNNCPPYTTLNQATASCVNQTFPAPAYTSGFPLATPLVGTIGVTVHSGVKVYGPLEMGFTVGQACSNNKGSCPAGMDLEICEYILKYECGTANVLARMLPDACGGHASPYHEHMDLACENTTAVGSTHSPLLAVMLDGRGLYGMYESTNTMPTDLDACGGHYGPAPATTVGGVTYPAQTNVYHYHTQMDDPHTIACYGPVSNLATAKSLYTGCSGLNGTTSQCTSAGYLTNYNLYCPPGAPTYTTNASCNTTSGASTATVTVGASAAAVVAAGILAALL